MKVTILAFGIIKDIFGTRQIELEIPDAFTISELRVVLNKQYPGLTKLSSFLVALNNEYAGQQQIITHSDEIAIIPPVSGG